MVVDQTMGGGVLIIFLVLMVFAAGVLGLFAMLIANPSTRRVTLGLLGLLVAGGVSVMLLFASFSGVRQASRTATANVRADVAIADPQVTSDAMLDELNRPRIALGEGVESSSEVNIAIETTEGGKLEVVEQDGRKLIRAPRDTPASEVMELIDNQREAGVDTASDTPRPDWVKTPPKRVGGTHRTVIESGPYSTLEECYADADWQLLNRAEGYTQQDATDKEVVLTSPGQASRVLPVAAAALRERLWRDEHVETVETSVGEMKRLYTLMEITPSDGRWLVEQRRTRRQSENLGALALASGGVLALVAGVFGLLKIDEATRGYYSKRLFIGVPLVILGLLLFATIVVACPQAELTAPTSPRTNGPGLNL